jgi:phosphate:Na+ symporter
MDAQAGFWEITIIVLSVLGSLTLFLFGMKTMSEALQKIGGESMRRSFSSIANSKVKGFLSGFVVTGTIQSSTAVIIILVSFINAGIFTLNQALPIMIGANIGTTITAWLVTLLGFHSKLSLILLPLMAFALPLLFRKNKKHRNIAELIVGFTLIFTGFYFLQESLPTISRGYGFVEAISKLSISNFGTDLLYALIGIILTVLIRSSSAATALTIVICYNGWMNFENAAAMIIGTNVGTTLTANIVARQAINPAQRLALAHTLFNVAGAILFFGFFRYSVIGAAEITEFVYGISPMYSITAIPIGLAVYHTGFNLITGLFFFALSKTITSTVELLIPVKQNESRKMSLKYMETGYLSMSEMLLIQVQDEIVNYGKQISDMFSLIPEYLSEKQDEKFLKIQKKIFKFEDKADNKEVVISNYLTRLAVNSLTEAASRKVSSMLKIVDDIESIADQCVQLEKTIRQKNEAKAWLNPEMREQILKMFTLVHEAIENMNNNLAKNYTPGILIKATEIELKINNARDNFLNINRKNIENGEYSYQNGALFAEIANHCEKIGDHIINVNQAIATNIKS